MVGDVNAAISNADVRGMLDARQHPIAVRGPGWRRPAYLGDLAAVIIRHGNGRPAKLHDLARLSASELAPIREIYARRLADARPSELAASRRQLADFDAISEAIMLGVLSETVDEILADWQQGVWMRVNEGVVFGELREAELVSMDSCQQELYDPPVGTQFGTYFKTARRHELPDGSSVPVWRYGRRDRLCAPACAEHVTCPDCGTGDYLAYEHALEAQAEHKLNLPSPHELRVGQRVRCLPVHGLTWPNLEFDAVVEKIGRGSHRTVTVRGLPGSPMQGKPFSPYAQYAKALEP